MRAMDAIKRTGKSLWVYLKESWSELSKVNWPTRGEVVRMTAIVIVLSGVVGLLLAGFDLLFDRSILQFVVK
jgi:preprotein translocase SecE subunit